MTTDDWVTAALTDDAVVVELLFRLKQSSEPESLRWGNRQPRSKPAAAVKKEEEWTRCSPTTPLSWSGGGGGGDASPSDGCDESCRRSDRSSGGRSKGVFTNETTATVPTNKRARRKKTFAELKEEESVLLKERTCLKKELARFRVTLEEQKARNENLKRLKLDLPLQSAKKMAATTDELEAANSCQSKSAEPSTLDHFPVSPTVTIHADHQPSSFNIEKEVERCFVLPDLNMMPDEEDPDSGLS